MSGALPGAGAGPPPDRVRREPAAATRRGGAREPDGQRRGEKSPQAFRTISEVAQDLEVPPHVLRFWETKFNQVRPLKRGGGRRYYRPEDVDLLRRIRALLYREGYTIKGVQRVLREGGSHVPEAAASRAAGAPEGAVAPSGGGAAPGADPGEAVGGAAREQEGEGLSQAAVSDLIPVHSSASPGASPGVSPGAPAGVPAEERRPRVAQAPEAAGPAESNPSEAGPTAVAEGTRLQASVLGAAEPGGAGSGSSVAAAAVEGVPGAVATAPEVERESRLAARDAEWRQRLGRILLDLRTVREVLQRELQQPPAQS